MDEITEHHLHPDQPHCHWGQRKKNFPNWNSLSFNSFHPVLSTKLLRFWYCSESFEAYYQRWIRWGCSEGNYQTSWKQYTCRMAFFVEQLIYKKLNSQTLRETHTRQSTFQFVSQVPANTFKIVIDAVDGYHIIKIDKHSQQLTTFITEWGRYHNNNNNNNNNEFIYCQSS